jgi:hypothetical protein
MPLEETEHYIGSPFRWQAQSFGDVRRRACCLGNTTLQEVASQSGLGENQKIDRPCLLGDHFTDSGDVGGDISLLGFELSEPYP